MFLDFNHDMMYVDEFASNWKALERVLGENLLESVVVLNELRQGRLQAEGD